MYKTSSLIELNKPSSTNKNKNYSVSITKVVTKNTVIKNADRLPSNLIFNES